MKTLLLLFTCMTIFSCSKDPAPPRGSTAKGSIQYKVNGDLIVMDNADVMPSQYVAFIKQLKGIFPETRYSLDAQKDATNFIIFALLTDSASHGVYHYDSTFNKAVAYELNYNGQMSAMFFKDDYFDIDISSYKNGRISATFSAKYSPYTGSSINYNERGSVVITDGKLNNIEVIY